MRSVGLKCLLAVTVFLSLSLWAGLPVAGNGELRESGSDPGVAAKRDTVVLLEEGFEDDFLPGWNFDNNTPPFSGWHLAFGTGAYEGEGYAEIIGFEPQQQGCVDKTKVLRTPFMSLAGIQTVQVGLYQRNMPFNDGGTTQSGMSIAIEPVDTFGKAAGPPIPLTPTVQERREEWMYVFLEVDRDQFPSENFRFTITYTSTPNVCPTVWIDNIRIVGIELPDIVVDTAIVAPEDIGGVQIVELGQQVTFRAESVGDPATNVRFDWLVIDGSGQNPPLELTGPTIAVNFSVVGSYRVLCAVTVQGITDDTPDSRSILVVRNRDLNTLILEPRDLRLEVVQGEILNFRATAEGGNTGAKFVWAVSEANADHTTRVFNGSSVDIDFPKPGIFHVLCSAQDEVGFLDPSPAFRVVEVLGPHVRIVDPVPLPRRREIVVPAGEMVSFQGLVNDPAQQFDTIFWVQNPGGQVLCTGKDNCGITFDQPGRYSVAFAGSSDGGGLETDFLRVVVDPPLFLQIVQPLENAEIPVNQPFPLEGEVIGNQAEDAQSFWVFGGQVVQGNQLQLPGIGKPGHYQARFNAIIPKQGISLSQTVNFLIFDPEDPPTPQILSPKTNLRVPPGETIFFDSSFRGIRRSLRNPLWEIRDENDTLIKSGHNETLGRVVFNEPGTYVANLFRASPLGNRLVDRRSITVGDFDQSDFGQNTGLDSAAPLDYGNYDQLDLDRANFFSLNVPENGLTLEVHIEADGPVLVVVFNAENQEIARRTVNGSRSFHFSNLPAGDFKVALIPGGDGKRRALSSFGVAVLNPALFFADITETATAHTAIGLVNPTGSLAEIEIIGYDADGAILDKVAREVQAHGSFKDTAINLFPDVVDQLDWIRVDSTSDLVGYSRTVSIDDLEGYAVSAAKYLESELFVPHIAEATQTWFTRGNLVNGQADAADPLLVTGDNTSFALTNQTSYTKDSFDFLTKLGGNIPSGTSWGRIVDQGQSSRLTGTEVFGKVDGTRQVVGLSLTGLPRNNPNFVSASDRLFFAHIANVLQFWTGIAIVNVENVARDALIKGYNANGVLLGQKLINLGPLEKLVGLAENILDGIPNHRTIAWIEVQGDGDLVGYELFGTHDVKQMAGLEVITEVKKNICFPFVEPGGGAWHGVALVNVTNQATQNLVFRLYDDQGGVVAVNNSQSLAATQKKVFLLTDLFGTLPLEGAWVEVSSDREVVGFELFGNSVFEHMSGLIAQ